MQSAIATPMPARLSTMSPLYTPAAHGELLPVEHNLALIPTLLSNRRFSEEHPGMAAGGRAERAKVSEWSASMKS